MTEKPIYVLQYRRWREASPDQREAVARQQIAAYRARDLLPDTQALLDDPAAVIMPNGKLGRDCDPEELLECAEWAKAIQTAARQMARAVVFGANTVGFRI